ncbi:MAG TPA: cytochrome P450, partial [Solirubrobacterales bacterium]
EDALTVLRDTESYSNLRAHELRVEMPDQIRAEVGADYRFPLISQLDVLDPPQHTRIRKLIQPTWTPKAIEARAPEVREIAEGLIDDFVDSGRTDFMKNFAAPLPPMVMAKLLGAPLEDAQRFMGWLPSFFMLSGNARLPEKESIEAWHNVIAFDNYTRELIEDHRANPKDDLTTSLIDARSDDGSPALNDEEIMGNMIGFIGAGSHTSSILLVHTLHLLLKHPDQWERVKADRSLAKKAVEEALRHSGAVVSTKRTTTKEVTLNGVTIPEGQHIWVNLVSANRDDEVFENPDVFDIDRTDVGQHLGFGKWTHFCIGSPLARLEGRIGLECVIDRLPDLRIAADQGPLEYSLNMVIPEVHTMEVEWTPGG